MTDVIAPSVSNVSPADGAVDVDPDASFQFDISDASGDASSSEILDTLHDRFPQLDLSGQVGPGIATFDLGFPYLPGSLKVWIDGVRKNHDPADALTPHPSAGTFTMATVPPGGSPIQAEAIPDTVTLVNVRLDSVEVRVNGTLAFQDGAFLNGYAGTIAPLPTGSAGYRFIFDATHPLFITGSVNTVEVRATDYAGNVMTPFTWSFTVLTFTLEGLSQSVVENNGGYLLSVRGTFSGTPVRVHLINISNPTHIHCYSGKSGSGEFSTPTPDGEVFFVTPPIPTGTYKLHIHQGDQAFDSGALLVPFYLEAVPANWHSRTFSLRRVFPPWYKTGPRTLDSVGILT